MTMMTSDACSTRAAWRRAASSTNRSATTRAETCASYAAGEADLIGDILEKRPLGASTTPRSAGRPRSSAPRTWIVHGPGRCTRPPGRRPRTGPASRGRPLADLFPRRLRHLNWGSGRDNAAEQAERARGRALASPRASTQLSAGSGIRARDSPEKLPGVIEEPKDRRTAQRRRDGMGRNASELADRTGARHLGATGVERVGDRSPGRGSSGSRLAQIEREARTTLSGAPPATSSAVPPRVYQDYRGGHRGGWVLRRSLATARQPARERPPWRLGTRRYDGRAVASHPQQRGSAQMRGTMRERPLFVRYVFRYGKQVHA